MDNTDHPSIRILYIDDNPHDRELVKDALEQAEADFTLTLAESREQFESLLDAGDKWDLILSDFNILGFNGLQVLEFVKNRYPDLPVLIVTGTGSEEIAVEAMRSGAADYAIKTASHIRSLPHIILKVLENQRIEMERRNAIEALKESEIRFREMFEKSNIGKAIVSMNGSFLEVNDAFAELTGYDRMEITGRGFVDITHPDDKELSNAIIQKLNASHLDQARFEKRYIRKNGEVVWADIHTILIRDDHGNPRHFVTNVMDITESVQQKKELERLNAELNKAQHMADIGSWEFDVATGKPSWSPHMFCIFGLDPEQGEPSSWEAHEPYIHPDDWPLIDRAVRRAISDGTGYNVQFRLKRPDGTLRWANSVCEVETGPDGRPATLRGTTQDIHKEITQRLALAERESKYRLLAENTLDCIWQMDMDRIVTYINPAVQRMFGYTPEEIIGSSMDIFCDNESRMQIMGVIQHELKNLENHSGVLLETTLIRKDGSPIPVEIRGQILRDADQKPVAIQGVSHDLTERKEMEQQQLLIQKELQQAQKMEAVGRLAGGVAHDFNNMLNVILGYSEMAAARLPDNHPVQDQIRRILEAATKSANLTRQLLAFSRKQDIEPKIVNLNELIDGNLKMLNRLIGEHITLEFKPENDLWNVSADPSQIDQILANLCINARDAITGTGGISISTRNVAHTQQNRMEPVSITPGDYVEISVRDNGCGMDEETCARIFEPFFTTKEEGKGTGLGLSTVFGIVQQSGGTIRVDSKPGEGTTFHLFFPRATDSCCSETDPEHQGDSFEGGETILIVEDEREVLDVATRALEMHGYTILTADSPARGLDIAKSHPETIDLLLTDVVMPEMNGRQLQEQVKTLRPDIHTLFMSGYTADVIEEHGGTGEEQHLLHKPFTISELIQSVRKALDDAG